MSLIHWLQLSLTDGIGPILARRLVEHTGSVESACAAGALQLREVEGIGLAKAAKIAESLRNSAAAAAEELGRSHDVGAKIFCPDDEIYPLLLKTIPDPPLVLYMKGTIEPRDLNAVAIVGSRKCSFYGREQAERFGALLAGAGVTVLSGGARGIDSAAHRGALSAGNGRTIAVLGSAINVNYPPENASLFEQIAAQGAVLSEYPTDTAPTPENFPRRNRIVSGMSRGVLVIEADERSGALITARQAGDDHGRPVFALPGRVDNRMSSGPHLLIRDGATLVTKLEDILEGLGPLPQQAHDWIEADSEKSEEPAAESAVKKSPTLFDLNESQTTIMSHLDSQPITVEQIIELTELDASVIMRELTFLTLKGAVRRVNGQSYSTNKN